MRQKSDLFRCANTRHLTRILNVLREARKPMRKIEVKRRTGLEADYLTDGLIWLGSRGLILRKNNGSGKVYSKVKSGEKQ